MPETQTKPLSATTVLAAEPQLFVADVDAACAYYVEKLGFSIAFAYGEPPFYAQVSRGGAALNLRALSEPAIDPELRNREELLAASITIDVAEPLFREFQNAGVEFCEELTLQPWGAWTFTIADLDGNRILFAASSRT